MSEHLCGEESFAKLHRQVEALMQRGRQDPAGLSDETLDARVADEEAGDPSSDMIR